MNRYKTPAPDGGYSTEFSQECWDVMIKDDIIRVFHEFLRNGNFEKSS